MYLYIESGRRERRQRRYADGALSFPEAHFQQDGKTQTYRSRWTHSGDRAYDVVTEFKKDGAWMLGWTVHLEKSGRRPIRPAVLPDYSKRLPKIRSKLKSKLMFCG